MSGISVSTLRSRCLHILYFPIISSILLITLCAVEVALFSSFQYFVFCGYLLQIPTEKLFKQLNAQLLSPDFQPYGQIIYASIDGKPYDSTDAQLVLQNGIPRFYIMRLHHKGYKFNTLTRHVQCTQCLGSLALKDWLIAVAPPTDNFSPVLEEITAFQIPGNCFIKLDVGTWHAGPYFDDQCVDFYNLELSDMNINDYEIYNFRNNNLELKIAKPMFC